MNKERFHMRFDTDDPRDKKVLEALRSVPVGRRSEYAIALMHQALELEDTMFRTIKRALEEYRLPAEQLHIAQPQAEDANSDMLGFIFALQEQDEVKNY